MKNLMAKLSKNSKITGSDKMFNCGLYGGIVAHIFNIHHSNLEFIRDAYSC